MDLWLARLNRLKQDQIYLKYVLDNNISGETRNILSERLAAVELEIAEIDGHLKSSNNSE